jgi:AcrR family transcriptional regulator
MTDAPGRRERKKAATRKTISDTATRLFLERGFDAVSIREIAEVADVSPTTVFAHFPQKEALVFDEDDAQRELLVAAVRDRPDGVSIPRALRDYFLAELAHADEHEEGAVARFLAFIDETPALADYGQRMWLRHGDALAEAIGAELGQETPVREVRAFARFVLQSQLLALADDDPAAMIEASFDLLERGWTPGPSA